MMLNFIANAGSGGLGFRWKRNITYASQKSMLWWGRRHQTQVMYHPGIDPHGWRNILNYYGWGSYTNRYLVVYQDVAYSSYTTAVKAAVIAMARTSKPVGILGWAGGHAQFLNGYVAVGENPAVSTNFTVAAVYLTDPLRSDHMRNTKISMRSFQTGSRTYKFTAYRFTDSPYDDPYTPGRRASYLEWAKRWVIIAPTR